VRANHRCTEVFKCGSEGCAFLTTSRSGLRDHHRTHHGGAADAPLKCALCPFTTPSQEALAQVGRAVIFLVSRFLFCSQFTRSQWNPVDGFFTSSFLIRIHFQMFMQCCGSEMKTPNPKCRLYWCLIEFIDWRFSQSCWYFRPL
jgi:hypothetical protein